MGRRLALLTCLVFSVGAASAAAADGVWGKIRVPGGVAALRRVASLGVGPRVRTSVLIDLTRASYGTSAKGSPEARERLLAYLTRLVNLERALAQLPNGVALSSATSSDRRDRDRLEAILTLLGLRVRTSRDQATVELSRDEPDVVFQRQILAAGINASALVEQLNKGERVRPEAASDDVPLPAPAIWSQLLQKDAEPLIDLVATGANLWLYFGLMDLDTDTLAWLAANPNVVRRIRDEQPEAFAAFARGLQVRSGQVVVPGGESAAPIWENLVDAPRKDPGRFFLNLLERNSGRLAYFYSTAASLDPDRQAFLLGAKIPEKRQGRDRLRYVEAIRDWFASACPIWDVRLQPFFRPANDPAFVISMMSIDSAGVVGPDWWPSVFQRIADAGGWPDRPKKTTDALRPLPATALWALYFVFEKPQFVNERWEMLRFAQRQFQNAPKTSAPDVEIALRAFKDLPALALSLERMGVTDPAVFAEVARAAHRLAEAAPDQDAVWALRAWQGALATLEQTHRHRPIPRDVMQKLVVTLVRAMPANPLQVSGHTAAWMLHEVLPALGAGVEAEDVTENDILRRLLAGGIQDDRQFIWEGLPYRVDTRGPVLKSVTGIRTLTTGPKLQHLVVLDEVARRMAAPVKSLEELAAIRTRLESVQPVWQSEQLKDAIDALKGIKAVKDLPKVARQRPAVLGVIDGISAEVWPALAYTLAVSPSGQPPRVFVDSPRVHELGTREITGRWQSFAWQVGVLASRHEGGVAIRGSLFGLDLTRAQDHLARAPGVVTRPLTGGGAIHEITSEILVDRIVLRGPSSWSADSGQVAAAIGRGRAKFAAWRSEPPGEDVLTTALTVAGIGTTRQNQLRWLLDQPLTTAPNGVTTDLDNFLSVSDFFHLGATTDLAEGWGQSSRQVDGCWCARGVDRMPIERFRGYTVGYVAAMSTDLLLRLAELLEELHLPADLIEPMLPFAMLDLIDQSAQFVPDDWQPMSWAGLVPLTRIEDYLQALVSRQVLAPPGEPRVAR